jgi:DNA-binding response OmpR family regulator
MIKIILLEDDPSVAVLLQSSLAIHGYSVDHYSKGTDFLNQMPPVAPAIVVSDYQLPDLTIYDLFTSIQAHYTDPLPRFLVISACKRPELNTVWLDYFEATYIEKPFKIADFIRTIKKISSKSSQ